MSRLTVLMTVRNGAAYLRESIDSLLAQSFGDFRVLIVDNASDDGSREIVGSYADPRLELLPLPADRGQIPALNAGLERIDTPLVARMDADDVALPHRFARQLAFLDAHPEVGVCGSWVRTFGARRGVWRYPADSADIRVQLLFECCLAHPSVMMRKDLLDRHRLRYDETLGHSEDWDLWQRAGGHFQLANLTEVLLNYRVHAGSVTQRTLDRQQAAALRIDDAALGQLGLAAHPLRRVHRDVAFETMALAGREASFLDDVAGWFAALRQANRQHGLYDPPALDRFLRRRLFVVLTKNARHGRRGLALFRRERLDRAVPLLWRIKFGVKTLPELMRGRHSRP